MIEKSFRVIYHAGKLPVKKKGWMMEPKSNWPWHITHWDNWGDVIPEYLTDKKTGFNGESRMKILAKNSEDRSLQVKVNGYKGVLYELT